MRLESLYLAQNAAFRTFRSHRILRPGKPTHGPHKLSKMVYVWQPAVIGGVAAGGAVILFFSVGLLVVVGLKIRHRRKLAAINAAGERRLSRYPGGNLSLADGEFSQVPGPKNFLQRSGCDPYGPSKVWTAIPSRESIDARPLIRKPPNAVTSDRAQQKTDPPQLSWPLPKRLTRSKAIPLIPIKELSLSPITERLATNPGPSPAIASTTGIAAQKALGQDTDNIGQALSSDCNGSPQAGVWPVTALKPRPLFHSHQRSISARTTPQAPTENVALSLDRVINPRDSFPFASCRPELPRSVSLGSQSSGVAPDGPVPPLPVNARKSNRPDKIRVNAAGSPSRTSVGSFASEHSSILQDRVSQQAETNFTSLSLLSPHSGLRIYDGSKIWDPSRMSSTATSPGPSANTNIHTQLLTQRSFRASIGGYSLPRSTSSGLSMSLLNQHTPKAEPKTPGTECISNVLPVFNSARNLEIPRSNSVRRQLSRECTLARLTSNRNSLFNVYDDVRNKRASTSILQDVSGNLGSPLRNELAKRPTSIATSNPFQWDPATSMKPGQLAAHRGWRRGHKRQNCVHISNLTPLSTPGRFLPTLEEPDEQSHVSTQVSGLQIIQAQPPPPSQPNFDHIIRAPSRSSQSTRPTGTEGPYSPTLAMVHLYRAGSDSSGSSIENPTPTRNPSQRRTDSQRRRNLFSSSSKTNPWPSLSIPSSAPRPALPLSPPSDREPPPSDPPNPLSPILHFPPPPLGLPLSAPSYLFRNRSIRNPSHSPVRGPRAPPSPTRTYHRTQRTRAEKRLSPMRDLRKSVMALRRMNSEISESEVRAGSRYLRMGRSSSSPSLDDHLQPSRDGGALSRESSILTRENSARSALGVGENKNSVRSGLGRENSVMGGTVIREEAVGGRKSEEADSLARVEKELVRLRELYPVREREREREMEMERARTPMRGVVEMRGQWGTPGSLYDRDGFLRE